METLIEYTSKLASIIEKYRDQESGELEEIKPKDKEETIEILCQAFTHIIDINLVTQLYQNIQKQFEENIERYSDKDIDEALEFFDTFISFEEQLFEHKNIPSWVVKETLTSAGDIKHLIRRFMTESNFRNEVLNDNEINEQVLKIKDTVCKIHSDHEWKREREQRFIINSFAIGAINTTVDLVSGAMVLFTLVSSAASAVIAWRRTHW